jgi:hypothetical protein
MIAMQTITVFWGKKWHAIVPLLLCMNQEYMSALKSERLLLFLCFQSCSMNECSQSLPITVLMNTDSKIVRNLELFQ